MTRIATTIRDPTGEVRQAYEVIKQKNPSFNLSRFLRDKIIEESKLTSHDLENIQEQIRQETLKKARKEFRTTCREAYDYHNITQRILDLLCKTTVEPQTIYEMVIKAQLIGKINRYNSQKWQTLQAITPHEIEYFQKLIQHKLKNRESTPEQIKYYGLEELKPKNQH